MKAISTLASDEFISSDVGFIPKSWQCQPLRSLLIESPKYGINAPAVALESDIPVYVRITDISEDGYFRPGEKVGVRSPISHLYRLQEGDIVLARTGASVGKSYLYNADDGELVYAGFLIKVSCDQSLFLPRFLRHFLHTEFFWSWVKVNSMRSGQPGINGNEFARLPIPVPPLSEQTAIANALSDVDALIQELEKLIAKKQAIKTATMQQLLTGRTRLPQFAHHPDGRKKGYKPSELGEIPEDWEVCDLGYAAKVQGGYAFKSDKFATQGVAIIRIGNIQSGLIDTTDLVYYPHGEQVPKQFEVFRGDALIAMSGATTGKVGIYDSCDKAYTNQRVGKFVAASNNVSMGFIHHLVSSELYKNLLESQLEQGAQPNVSSHQLETIQIRLPSDKTEQEQIALMLTEMDQALQALDRRLSKTRQIKQGMMQELLTGKIRLVKPAGAV